MIEFFEKRSLGWLGIVLSCILVVSVYILPFVRQIQRYAFIYKGAFIDTAPTLILKDGLIEFIGQDSLIVPLENNIQFFYSTLFDSCDLKNAVPGSISLSQTALYIRLKHRIKKIDFADIKNDADYYEVRPAAVRDAVTNYTFLVLFSATFITLIILFLVFLFLCLLAAGLCSIIDSFAVTSYTFKLFFHLSGSVFLVCVVLFVLLRFEFARIGITILLYLLMTMAVYVMMQKYYENKKVAT